MRFAVCRKGWRYQLLDRFAPYHLTREDSPEVAGSRIDRPLDSDLHARFGLQFQAGHSTVPNSARDDPPKVAQISCDIQGKTVRGDAL